jgi:Peptidase family M23
MPLAPITGQSWRFVPPLDLPLSLRLENGRFGALRPKPLPGPAPCATSQVIPAGDPRNPTRDDVHFMNQIHEAVDLAATAGDCVFAASGGRVVAVESNPGGTAGNVIIDHHPEGLGFLTKYNHITDITVAAGAFVQKGAPFAAVSAEPTEPHLHFELWAAIDRPATSDNDRVPLDPTRPLYAWEQRTLGDEDFAGGALAPQSIGVTALHTVPFFSATFETDTTRVLYVPMYEPMTADEQLLIDLLREAYYRNADVAVRSRTSPFWGIDVVTQVQL